MNSAEWLTVNAYVEALWPRQGWPDSTVTHAGPTFAPLDVRHVKRALTDAFREGREYPPSPSVVFARALAFEQDVQPALEAAELTREPTPEETEAAARGRGVLQAAVAELAARRELNGG